MTDEQEKILEKHAASIRSKAMSADVADEIIPLYRQLSGDHSFVVKPGCRGCIEDLMNYLTYKLQQHEREKATRQAIQKNKKTNK